jgi:uncharacterized protein YneF (UPF0154 family)
MIILIVALAVWAYIFVGLMVARKLLVWQARKHPIFNAIYEEDFLIIMASAFWPISTVGWFLASLVKRLAYSGVEKHKAKVRELRVQKSEAEKLMLTTKDVSERDILQSVVKDLDDQLESLIRWGR